MTGGDPDVTSSNLDVTGSNSRLESNEAEEDEPPAAVRIDALTRASFDGEADAAPQIHLHSAPHITRAGRDW